MKKVKKLLLILLAALVLSGAAFGIYTADYYRMDETAAAVCAAPAGPYEIRNGGGRCLVFEPERAEAGLIFYPGGKVEYTAYAPLMAMLQERGVLCVLCKMPFNLAVLDGNAADGIPARFPSVTRWYVGGHSLGGVMAAYYAADHADALEGLLLLAAYSTKDLAGSGLRVLTVRGSEDGVLNRKNYDRRLSCLPADCRELVIEGGCHAFFGSYGDQRGDGVPTVSRQEQLSLTAQAAADFMLD